MDTLQVYIFHFQLVIFQIKQNFSVIWQLLFAW